ncbi:MAG TPA: alpha/beta hydrolase [Vicinamibacterales bacterium]
MSKALRLLAAGGAFVGAAAVNVAYRKAMKLATDRVETGRQFIDSPEGRIEFAEAGDGPAVLVSHGAGGGFDQGLWLGATFLTEKYRVVAPSRFGYLGTQLPVDASPEAQADAYVSVLDALQLDTVPVVGVSAGAPAAMQMALRYPERCSALALIVPMAFAPERVIVNSEGGLFGVFLNFIAQSDFFFWSATKVAHGALLKTILGTPIDVYEKATPAQRRQVNAVLHSIFPISRRTAGIMNDAVISSTLTRYALEDIHTPTLVISVADDLYGTYEPARYTAQHIPGAKFIGFADGGHLLVGDETEVRSEIELFLSGVVSAKEEPVTV